MIVKLQDDTYHEEQTSEHDSLLTALFKSTLAQRPEQVSEQQHSFQRCEQPREKSSNNTLKISISRIEILNFTFGPLQYYQ